MSDDRQQAKEELRARRIDLVINLLLNSIPHGVGRAPDGQWGRWEVAGYICPHDDGFYSGKIDEDDEPVYRFVPLGPDA